MNEESKQRRDVLAGECRSHEKTGIGAGKEAFGHADEEPYAGAEERKCEHQGGETEAQHER